MVSISSNCIDYNNRQTEVGHSLYTLKGSMITREPRYKVGKRMGNKVYFHKSYLNVVLKDNEEALEIFYKFEPLVPFEYAVIRWDRVTNEFAFEECPDFDIAREPVVGRIFVVANNKIKCKSKFYANILHHKWLFVQNDYTGFDVAESWEWSRKWLNTLTEKAKGNNLPLWLKQLFKFNLQ